MPELSVVAPAFNQAATIQETLEEILRRLDAQGLDFELIVVSDGSKDGTYDAARRISDPRVRVLDYDRNLGKGFAVRTGSLAARGRWVAWIDSDLDLDPSRVGGFLEAAKREDLDIVVGSKRHPESAVAYPLRRRVYSWQYQMLVRALFALDVRDTQVGMKVFRREVLERVLPVVLVKRYAFDLEVLAVARHFGFARIAEHPITLEYRFTGSGVGWRAIANALWDTAAVFYRLRLRRYYDRQRAFWDGVAAARERAPASLTVVTAPPRVDAAAARRLAELARGLPPESRVVAVTEAVEDEARGDLAGVTVVETSERRESRRLRAGVDLARTEVVAILAPDARPSGGWAAAGLSLFGDPSVGAVVGPAVPRLGDDARANAAGILTESRLGVGGARVRSHVGGMHEIQAFPLTNVFVRREALREAVRDGEELDDELCSRICERTGLSAILSPDAIVTTRPNALFRPYLRLIHGIGIDRGARFSAGRMMRVRYLAPVALLVVAALGPAALAAGTPWSGVWGAVMGLYAAGLLALGAVTFLLHRPPRLTLLVMSGALASHVAFALGLLRGVLRRRRGDRGQLSPAPR